MKKYIGFCALILAVLMATIGVLMIVSDARARAAENEADEEKHLTRSLLYHAVSDTILSDDDALYASPAVFESHIKALTDNGYRTVFADEYGEYSDRTVCITFDDGYENVYTEAFPILKKYSVKATVFLITSDRPNHLTDAEIKEMAESGLVSFAPHTVNHIDMTTLTYDEMKKELTESKEAVERVSEQRVTCFAYPHGAYNNEVKKAVRECGFSFAYKADEGSGDVFAIPRKTVWRVTTAEDILAWLK